MTKGDFFSRIKGIIDHNENFYDQEKKITALAEQVGCRFSDSQNQPGTWTDKEIQCIGNLEKQLEELKSRVDDYETVFDHLYNGDLGTLKDVIEEAIKAAVKDQYIEVQKQVNDLRIKIDSMPIFN